MTYRHPKNLMHLTRFPEDGVEPDPRCHVCLEPGTLTREHVPPEKAFNDCTKLWDRLVAPADTESARRIGIRGGFWVKTLCPKCNNEVSSQYAKEYVKFVKNLVESPQLFDSGGDARLLLVKADTLLVAKEIIIMILAVEPVEFAIHNDELRQFVLDRNATVEPRFRIHAFLVPEHQAAGNICRFHARVDTFEPGFGFVGGELSWFPFGVVYATDIGEGYEPGRLTDITEWLTESSETARSKASASLFTRITAVDSIQCTFGRQRVRPQIDYLAPYFS